MLSSVEVEFYNCVTYEKCRAIKTLANDRSCNAT